MLGAIVNIVFGLTVFWILASIYNNNIFDGLLVTKNYLVSIFQSIGSLFQRSANKATLVGPVGISSMIVSTSGIFDFMYLMSIISVSLGITNLLPIPALDGGKIVLLIVELIRRKPINPEIELTITALGLAFLLMIATTVSIKDISKLFV